jgi:hypothetical protein
MAVTFDHQTWGDLGITSRYRYSGSSSSNPISATTNHTYWKDQALKKWLGDVNNVALDISSLTGTTVLSDGAKEVELQRADRAVDGFNACKGLKITFDVYSGVIDPATIAISNKGYGGWMAGDVADISGDWQITVLSADASLGLLRSFEDARTFSSGTNSYIGWMFGVDREVGDVGYTSGFWFHYTGVTNSQGNFQVFGNWQDLEGSSADNGYGTRTNYRNEKYAVYDQSDWQTADPLSTLNFTYCADPGNSFFSFSGDNPNDAYAQENYGWGFVRLDRPAGGSYAAGASEWVFTYYLPNTTSDANGLLLGSDIRVVTLGNRLDIMEAGTTDNELQYSSSTGYLMRNQPVFARGGLAGYMPPGLGWNSGYTTLDQMIDGDGYTWIKCHRRQWVKVQ